MKEVVISDGAMVQWCNGTMVQRNNGTAVQRCSGTVVQWQNSTPRNDEVPLYELCGFLCFLYRLKNLRYSASSTGKQINK